MLIWAYNNRVLRNKMVLLINKSRIVLTLSRLPRKMRLLKEFGVMLNLVKLIELNKIYDEVEVENWRLYYVIFYRVE